MGEHHGHHHGHAHATPTDYGRAFLISVAANGGFVLLQVIFAFWANSTSLLADAVHNFGDVLSLLLAWVAHSLSKRQPTDKATYGWKKSSIVSATANGFLLVFSCGLIVTEALYKIISPEHIQAIPVMLVAGIGIVINGATALLFRGNDSDLNIRAAFLHLFYDALISLGVVISAGIIYFTGWYRLDPLVGLLIVISIMAGTWTLFRESFMLLIDGVPSSISYTKVKAYLLEQKGVENVHDLHIWAMSTRENALSAHLVVPEGTFTDSRREEIVGYLEKEFNIIHVTLQVEVSMTHCEMDCG